MKANDDRLTLQGAREKYLMMEKEIITSSYNYPTKPSTDGYYHMQIPDPTKKSGRRQIKAKTIDELKEKIYQNEKMVNSDTKKTFCDVFEIAQKEKLKYVKNDEKRLSVQNTITRNRSEYNRFIAGTCMERMFIDEIAKRDIEDLIFANLSKYNLTYKGLQSLKSILKSCFDLAYQESWIVDNPYARINFKKYNDMLTAPTPTQKRAHEDDVVNKFLAYIHAKEEKCPRYLPAYALELQIAMGLRRGEIPPLLWTDIRDGYIEISKELLTIKKSEFAKKETFAIVHHTKTYKDRRFPITEEVQDILRRLRHVHERFSLKSEFLFPAKNEIGVITNNTVYNFYRRMCKALNIPISKECIKGCHSFRRNAITKVVNASGGDVMMASKLFGNTPDVAERNYYTGLDLNRAKDVIESTR